MVSQCSNSIQLFQNGTDMTFPIKFSIITSEYLKNLAKLLWTFSKWFYTKGIFSPLKLSFSWEGTPKSDWIRSEETGGVWKIRYLKYEPFPWKHGICLPERWLAKPKYLWITFHVFSVYLFWLGAQWVVSPSYGLTLIKKINRYYIMVNPKIKL